MVVYAYLNTSKWNELLKTTDYIDKFDHLEFFFNFLSAHIMLLTGDYWLLFTV